MTMDLNRRDFLKGAGVVGALGAVATMGVGCAPSPVSYTHLRAHET